MNDFTFLSDYILDCYRRINECDWGWVYEEDREEEEIELENGADDFDND